MKLSCHKHVLGKPEAVIVNNRREFWQDNRKINLGYNWVTLDAEYAEVFEMLSVHGIAIAPALTSNHRHTDNFLSCELVLVDIDQGMTLSQLKDFEFYQRYGAGYYTTPSHTDEAHRFRLIYRLPVPITDADLMAGIYEGMLAVHGAADISCKDASRLFYGTVNAAHSEITDRMLDADALLQMHNARESQVKPKPVLVKDCDVTYSKKDVSAIAYMLDELKKYYADLNYDLRRTVTWAVASECSDIETVSLMRSRWSDSEKNGKYEMLLNGRRRNAISIGTIYHLIRKYNSGFGVREVIHKSYKDMTLAELRAELQRRKDK